MNQYHGWPFAKGGEGNIRTATAVFLASLFLHLKKRSRTTQFLLGLAMPVWLTVLYFFRDPERDTLAEDGLVVCPADGEVVEICTMREPRYLQEEVVRVSIFLSLLDVHVQRVPISGRVTAVDYVAGQFLQAFKPEASEVNEYIATCIETPYGAVLTKQIAGILARRCVSYVATGQNVRSGDRLGVIRFSSRVDLFLPKTAVLEVGVGDKVFGGVTRIATFPKR